MRTALHCCLLTLLAGCARSPRLHDRELVRRIARGPTRVAARTAGDSEIVRRLCVAPDSVLAGRADCVLRYQAAFRVF